MSETLQPDPSMIGGVPQAPFALVPDALALFQTRARRLSFLAESSELAPYLTFLAALTRLQARLALTLPRPDAPPRASAPGMPVIDRARLAACPRMQAVLDAVLTGATELEMPAEARLALEAVRAASPADRAWLLGNVLSDQIPEDSTAPHLFAAAAVQLHMARLAAQIDAASLAPVATGICPSCGGRPVTSSIKAAPGIESIRYATCSCCATEWNEVRVKCLCCGAGKGLAYRSAETHDATVKAETCSECKSWVKILNLTRNPSLDAVADDLVSLGLDIMMRQTEFTRRGFNPWMVGY